MHPLRLHQRAADACEGNPGDKAFSPAISAAPSRSPEGSPAIRNSFKGPLIACFATPFADAPLTKSVAKQAMSDQALN